MVRVTYDAVEKRYGDTLAVEGADIEIEDGEFAVLLGPSGCGKTTTLRCLAGLTEPTAGTVRLDEHDITDVHPKNRNIAMVFQQFALYPHMNVRENIGYPLKVAGVDGDARSERVEEVAETVEIGDLLDREVDQLSGGQRQRVALARAIIRRPAVFLMDEPLASLDAKLKVSMRARIKRLQRELGVTTLYVTHDQEEAMTLGDKLIVMNEGRIQQIGTPDEVYHEPANRFVAGFIGSPTMNVVEVEWAGDRTVRRVGDADGFELTLDEAVAARYEDHDRFVLGIRPQYFTAHTKPAGNAIKGTVEVTEPLGDEQLLDVVVEGGVELTAKVSNTIAVGHGDPVWLTVRDGLVHGFDTETGDRIEGGGDAERYVAKAHTSGERKP